MRYIKVFIILILSTLKINAQDPQFTLIDKSKGLPSNTVYSIHQDINGYIWFATDKGIVKYDGFEFKIFFLKNQSSVSGTNIKEDSFGRIWYQNFDGNLFYVINDTIIPLNNRTPIGFFNYGIIDNRLFVVRKNGIDIYDLKVLKKIKAIDIVDNDFIYSSSNNNYFFVTCSNSKVYRINKQLELSSINSDFSLNYQSPASNIFAKENFCFLYSKNASTKNPIYKLENDKYNYSFSTKSFQCQSIALLDSSLWFCTQKGVYVYGLNGEIKNNERAYFRNYSVSFVLKDKENSYWFSTTDNGVFYVKDLSSSFFQLQHIPFKAVVKNNKLIYSNSNGELIEFNPKNSYFNQIFKSNTNKSISYCYYDSLNKSIITSNGFIETIHKDGKIKSEAGALKEVDLIDNNYYAYAISGACVLDRINDSKVDSWTDFYNKNMTDSSGFAKFVLGCRAKSVKYISSKKTIYFATSYGLFIVKPHGYKELKFKNRSIYCNKLCKYHNVIYALTSDHELLKIDDEKISYHSFQFNDSLESINFIKVCNDVFFISTDHNFYKVNLLESGTDLKRLQSLTYEVCDVELIGDSIFILTKDGILIQSDSNEDKQQINPKFIINSIRADNTSIKTVLEYFENNITINYSILSFRTNNYYPLLYRINQGNWQLLGPQTRQLQLFSLSPNSYKIDFKFKDLKPILKTISFTIKKPFWQTWWFILLIILIISIVVILFARWRINELRQKNKLLTDKVENEQKYYQSTLKAIRAQMNPHFFYNALNTIQSLIYSNDKRNASNYLSKFSKLTRMILEMTDKDQNSLHDEITALKLYLELEQGRFVDEFNFEIAVNNDIDIHNTSIPPMLIQPYVENAIKHGLLHKRGLKVLKISFLINNKTLVVTIDDNGIGRHQSNIINKKRISQHQSFSMKANETRLEILNNGRERSTIEIIDKFDDSNLSIGTTVIIYISLNFEVRNH